MKLQVMVVLLLSIISFVVADNDTNSTVNSTVMINWTEPREINYSKHYYDGMEVVRAVAWTEEGMNLSCGKRCYNVTIMNKTNETYWENITITECDINRDCKENVTVNHVEVRYEQQDFVVEPPDTDYEKPNISQVWEQAKEKARNLFAPNKNATEEEVYELGETIEEAQAKKKLWGNIVVGMIFFAIIILIASIIFLQLRNKNKKMVQEMNKTPEERAKELFDAGYDEAYVERAYAKMKEEQGGG